MASPARSSFSLFVLPFCVTVSHRCSSRLGFRRYRVSIAGTCLTSPSHGRNQPAHRRSSPPHAITIGDSPLVGL
jgi:hypothetical protein